MPKYPKVNYIGNKEKLADWIIREMPVKSGIVVDIFAGGCSVSYALKAAGYRVIANDILYADYVIAKALIENEETTVDKEVLRIAPDAAKEKEIYDRIAFLADHLYYKDEVKELARLVAIAEQLDGNERCLFLALLRRAMIRKLPYSRMNVPWDQIQLLRDEEYSYEKYKRKRAYHNQSFESHILENIDAYNKAVFKAEKCIVYNEDAMTVAQNLSGAEVVYMDPPYPSTMNNYDAFYGLFDKMFDREREHVDFTCKNTFLDNMDLLLCALQGKTDYVVLSQNTRGMPGPEEIRRMLEKFGSVEIKEKNHNYQVTGKENKNSSKEILFILKMKK